MKSLYPGSINDAVARGPPGHHSRCTPKPGVGRNPVSTGRSGTDTSYSRTPALYPAAPARLSPSWAPKYFSLSR